MLISRNPGPPPPRPTSSQVFERTVNSTKLNVESMLHLVGRCRGALEAGTICASRAGKAKIYAVYSFPDGRFVRVDYAHGAYTAYYVERGPGIGSQDPSVVRTSPVRKRVRRRGQKNKITI